MSANFPREGEQDISQLVVYNVFHHSMHPQNWDFNFYMYILYSQSSINYDFSHNIADIKQK